MYPFYVFDLPHDASDHEVEARYRALVHAYPPDRDIGVFTLVRSAYERLRDQAARTHTRLFYVDYGGQAFIEEYPVWLRAQPRRRLTPNALATLIRRGVAQAVGASGAAR